MLLAPHGKAMTHFDEHCQQGHSQEFDLGGYKSKVHTGHWHDIEFVLGQGDETTT